MWWQFSCSCLYFDVAHIIIVIMIWCCYYYYHNCYHNTIIITVITRWSFLSYRSCVRAVWHLFDLLVLTWSSIIKCIWFQLTWLYDLSVYLILSYFTWHYKTTLFIHLASSHLIWSLFTFGTWFYFISFFLLYSHSTAIYCTSWCMIVRNYLKEM